jgi:OmpA-OmpF porin, OOP family
MKYLIPALAVLAAGAAPAMGQTVRTSEQLLCDLAKTCGDEAKNEVNRVLEEVEGPESRAPRLMSEIIKSSSGASTASSRPAAQVAMNSSTARAAIRRENRLAAASVGRSSGMAGSRDAVLVPADVAGRAPLIVTFALGSADLTPASRAQVREFAVALSADSMKGRKFLIEGHTDASGTLEVNRELSQRRAEAVIAALAELDVDTAGLSAVGMGPDRPLDGYAATHPANRRVEVAVVD